MGYYRASDGKTKQGNAPILEEGTEEERRS